VCQRVAWLVPTGTAARVLEARQRHARLAVRAALTARLHGMAEADTLLTEACWWSTAATVDELLEITATAVRVAAVAIDAEPGEVLSAVLLMPRAAAEERERAEARGEA
jgi:hypothetical protein